MFELPKKFDREYSGIFRTIGRDVFSAGILKKEDTTVDWLGGSFPLFSVSVILRGRGTYVDEDGTEYPLMPGKLFFRIPHRKHSTFIEENSRWLEFYISCHFMSDDPADYGGADPHDHMELDEKREGYLKLKNMPGQDDSWIYPMCKHVFCIHTQTPVRDIDLSLALLNECFDFITFMNNETNQSKIPLEIFSLITKLLKSRREDFSDRITSDIKKIILENLTDNRSLPELLKDLPLSYPSLRQHFMRVMGHNLGEYQIQCRMEEAVNMLMRGMSVKETAFNLGYKDQFFFSKQFHQKLGYPPSAINPLNPRAARRNQEQQAAAETMKPIPPPPPPPQSSPSAQQVKPPAPAPSPAPAARTPSAKAPAKKSAPAKAAAKSPAKKPVPAKKKTASRAR